LIKEVRHKGLLVGVELAVKAEPVVRALQEKGVLALNAGPQVVRFLPPFTAEEEHFVTVTQTFEKTLKTFE
jgi:acetylornithine/LysW-gamma-L-lysine aminotransferase